MEPKVDVCLILEGTYPYIVGGVSRWVHQLVTGLPQLDFAIIHLRFGRAPQPPVYDVPPNVRQILTVPIELFHNASPDSKWWREILRLPRARLYHTLSTGFAGVLGVQIKRALHRPLLLTEHGIYWHEVASGANELECGFKVVGGDTLGSESEVSRLRPTSGDVGLRTLGTGDALLGLAANREHWTQTLRDLAHDAYQEADAITTVCSANQKLQLDLGAPPGRCRVIPNGVHIDARSGRQSASDPLDFRPAGAASVHFGFVGRVTPIKDVAAFLQAAAALRATNPHARFSIVGPLHHDPDYAAECRALARTLDLPDSTFVGETNPYRYYPKFTALVLTSVSEGLPYAALEAMSCGVPVIATDVGGCRELVLGAEDDLGPAGILTPPGDPTATAAAMQRLTADPRLAQRLGTAGRKRVTALYSLSHCLDAYAELYRELIRASEVKALQTM